MKLIRILCFAIVVVVVAGCATKRYTIATPLSSAETELMDCKDLQLELVRAGEIEKQINKTGEMDMMSVAGFLGDFGIGNSMAKEEARSALAVRVADIHSAQLTKGCVSAAESPSEEDQTESEEVQE